MIRYYITDRSAFGGSTRRLLEIIATNVRNGVEYIQIREKDLSARDLLDLARLAVQMAANTGTRILINDRADVALASGAHGVHLRSDPIPPQAWRRVLPKDFLIAVSCHSVEEVVNARSVDFVVFGPVFASPGKGSAVGIEGLHEAAIRAAIPVFALGGVTRETTRACVDAGAAGIAGIRLFQEN